MAIPLQYWRLIKISVYSNSFHILKNDQGKSLNKATSNSAVNVSIKRCIYKIVTLTMTLTNIFLISVLK